MKAIVIYKSKTGFTKTYAAWIAEELKCDLKTADSMSAEDMQKYDTIIYGGGVYAGGVNGVSLIKNNLDLLRDKKIIVWASGSSPEYVEQLQQMWDHNFTKEQLGFIRTFYLRGGFNYKKLKANDKFLMNLMRLCLKLKRHRTKDQQGMLDAFDVPQNYCDKNNIEELVKYAREA